jgi:regulator of protease activity HflC (stomatin/prohibitin superfamily)
VLVRTGVQLCCPRTFPPQAAILRAEAEKAQLINEAEGQARAVVVAGEARAASLRAVGEALEGDEGQAAAGLAVAENYVKAFGNLAKETNTLLLPANTGDVTGMVTQAMSIYKQLDPGARRPPAAPAPPGDQ